MPAAGLYQGPVGQLELIHVNGTEDACPTMIQFRFYHPTGVEIRSAMLGHGGSWTGAGLALLGDAEQSNGVWHLSAERDPASSVFTGIDFATTVWLNGTLVAFPTDGSGTTSRQYGPFTIEDGRAPDCMCNRVRQERDWNIRMRETYLRQDIRQYALDHNLRGSSEGARTYFRDGAVHIFEGEPEGPLNDMTYEALIDGFIVGELAFDAAGEIQVVEFPVISGGGGIAAYAVTDGETCEVTPPDLTAVRANCDPAILYTMAMAHEQQHEAMCLGMEQLPSYLSPEGQELTNHRGGLYLLAGNDPITTGDDEAAAYSAGLRVLNDWLSTHCDG